MLTLSDKNIEILGFKNQSLLYHLVNVSNLNKKWSQENFLEIEIKKSFIRGELRYSKEGSDIANSISQIIKKNQILDGYNFFTNIYPMIHLSNDLSEKSNLHFDHMIIMIYLLAGFQLLVIITIQLAFLNLVIKNLRIFYQEYLFQIFF